MSEMLIPFMPYRPDQGPLASDSTDVALNVIAISNGYAPFPSPTAPTSALPSRCLGSWYVRTTSGSYLFFAATQTNIYRLSGSGEWDIVSEIAADTIVNGAFTTDTIWTKPTGVTISGGVAVFTAVAASGSGLRQTQTLTAGTIYKVTFTVSGYSSGGVRPLFSGGTNVNGTTVTANGTYTQYMTALTGNTTFHIQVPSSTTTLNVDNVTLQAMTTYTGPSPGDLWTAAKYGSRLYLANENDPLQYIDVDSGITFAAAPGSPPQGKFVCVIGDFLFLAYLRVGATSYSNDWQHSAIDDPADWVIDGGIGSSDRGTFPAGEEITGIMSRVNNGGRIFQRNAKRALIFSPGGATAFEVRDIDPSNGVFAPYSVVDIGNDDYVYIHEQGVFRGDSHTAVGLDNISRTLLQRVSYDQIEAIQGILESRSRRALWRAQDQIGTWFVFGYDIMREKFFITDLEANALTNMVGVATFIDDITGLVDDYPDVFVDSPLFAGGRVAPGVWLTDNCMYALTGPPLEATIETPTFAVNPGAGGFVYGLMLRGDALEWSARIGSSALAETPVSWSPIAIQAARTGVVPTRVDANFHRVRITIPAGTTWSHAHAVTPLWKASRRLAA